MADIVIDREWSVDEAEAVVDALPDDAEQACHLLMMLACCAALELGMSKDNFLEETAKGFDVVASAAECVGGVQ